MPTIQGGRYLGGFPSNVKVGDQELEVTAHFAIVGGRMTCVGMDIRSFWSAEGFRPPNDSNLVLPVGEDWAEITSPLIRSIRTAEVIDAAYATSRAAIIKALEETLDAEAVADVVPRVDKIVAKDSARRGPRPLLDDEMLRDVVARTYIEAPRKPVQAVREALASRVAAYKGEVSPDVARKAVATARARGFIPPARAPRADGPQR